MADELGKYSVGIALDLRDLTGRVATVESILGRLEKGVDSLNEKGSRAGSGWLRSFAQLEIAEKILHGIHAAFDLIPELARKSFDAFEITVGAAGRYADALELQATLVGASVRETGTLAAALEAVGGSGDTASGVLLRLSRAIGAATGGGGIRIPPQQAFRELGVALTDAAGRGRPFGDLMDDLSRKFVEMPEGPRRTALAIAIFGGEAARMLKLFADLTTEGRTWQQNVEALGLTIDGNLLGAAAKLDNQLDILRAQSATTFRLIGAEAAPAFLPLIKELVEARRELLEWIKDNKEGIQDLAGVVSEKIATIVRAIHELMGQLRQSGVDIEDVFVKAVDLAAIAVLKLSRSVAQAAAALAMMKGIGAAALSFGTGGEVEDITKAWHEATDAAFDFYRTVDAGLVAAEGALEVSQQQTKAYLRHRDVLRELRDEYEALPADPFGETSPEERRAAVLAQMRERVVALGNDYLRLSEDERRYYESLGLHATSVEGPAKARETTQPPVPTYDTQEIESATKAIQKAIDAADEERAAILGGTQAKIAAIVASREYAAASDAERETLRAKLTDLDALRRALQQATADLQDFQAQGKQDIANRDRALALQKEAIQAALAAAKAHHDDQAILTQTAALSAVDAQQRVATEQDAIDRIRAALGTLTDARSEAAQITLQAAIQNGREVAGIGEQQIVTLRGQLQEELALREDQLAQVRAIAQQQAAAAQEAAQEEVDKLRGAVLDFKSITGSALDDMFEGGILGTQKMSKAWDSMWLSLGRTGLKTLKDMVLNKVAAFDDPMIVNFTELPAKLGDAFGSLKNVLGRIFGDTVADQKAQSKAVVSAPGEIAGPPAPEEAPGIFRRIGTAIGGLFGGGAGAGATAPAAGTVASMAVTAGTVFLSGPVAGPGVLPGGVAPPVGPVVAPPASPGGGPGATPGAAGGGTGTPAAEESPSAIASAVHGLGSIFQGVGRLLLQPLELVPNLLKGGFSDSVRTFATGTRDSIAQIGKGAASTVSGVIGGLGQLGEFIGGTLQTIGTLIGGKAGQIVSIIGLIISLLSSILIGVNASVSIFGTGKGASGGYFTLAGGFERPTGKSTDHSTDGAIPFWTHPGEGLINPEATRQLGGRDAIMDLNAGRIPQALLERMGAALPVGGVIRVPVPAAPLRGAEGVGQQFISQDRTLNVHPGALVVQVTEGMDAERVGRDLMRGLISEFGR